MIWLWIILLLALLAGLGLMVYRALQFKPQGPRPGKPRAANVPEMPIAVKLSELVRLPTVSRRNKEEEDLQPFLDFQARLQVLFPRVAAHCPRTIVGQTGIIYHWQGRDSADPRVLMSHYDVVPAQQEGWTRPPFSGEIADGCVHGRGTLDTKCTLVAALEAAEGLIGEGFVPQQDVYFCFSGDEEVMGPTAQAIIDALQGQGVQPGFVLDEGGAIVSDAFPGVRTPCAMVGICEKGMGEIILTASAKPGHASAPPRHTALGKLAKAIRKLENRPAPARWSKPVLGLFDTLGREAGFGMRLIFANLGFFRPLINLITAFTGGELAAMLRTTCAFTMAKASDASNVLPNQASATANIRLIPGDMGKGYRRRVSRVLGKRVDVQWNSISEPSPVSRTDDQKWAALKDAVQDVWPEALVSPYLMTACTDSRHYSRISENVYRFSAMALSKEERGLIHACDERIRLSTLAKMQAFYEALIVRL